MENQIFEAALGLATPWFVQGVDFDTDRKMLGIQINFVAGSRFRAWKVPTEFTRPSASGIGI
jgi:transposase